MEVIAVENGVPTTLFYHTTTDANGAYAFKSIYPTPYRVSFYKAYTGVDLPEYYGTPDSFSTALENGADVLVMAEQSTTGIDLVLGPDPKVYLPVVIASTTP